MVDRSRRILVVVIVVLLGAGLFALGALIGDGDARSGDGGTAQGGDGGGGGGDEVAGAANATGRTTFAATTPSAQVEGTTGGFGRIALGAGTVDVPDGEPVPAPLTITGDDLRVTGTFTFTPGGVTIDGATVVASGDVVVASGQERRVVEHDDADAMRITGARVPWTDAPAALTLRTEGRRRGTVSWAGGGHAVTAAGERIDTHHVGVKATSMAATVERRSDAVVVDGSAFATQVYADGLPRLPGGGFIDVKGEPRPVRAGERGRFTWAPTNRSGTDLVIVRVRAGSNEARWIDLALDRLPAMCGGTAPPSCPVTGGDTADFAKSSGFLGLGKTRPINAVILPGTGDERDISFLVPPGTPPGRYEMRVLFDTNAGELAAVIAAEVVA